ncbi:hypothetical protein ABID74_003746 [Gordonia terrae]
MTRDERPSESAHSQPRGVDNSRPGGRTRASADRTRLREMLVQLPYLLVMVGVLVAALLVMFDRWRRGSFVFGAALLVGAVLRAFIPSSQAGLLQVRGKTFDVTVMATVGGVMLWLAASIDSLGTD